jgi:hypothetical protein
MNALFVGAVAASAIWVYWDASGHRVGKVPGGKGMFNMSAGAWGVVTLLLWIVAFPSYLAKRGSLILLAKTSPIDSKGRAAKAVVLAAVGGFWFLSVLAASLGPTAGGQHDRGFPSGSPSRTQPVQARPAAPQ